MLKPLLIQLNLSCKHSDLQLSTEVQKTYTYTTTPFGNVGIFVLNFRVVKTT